jgi:hypothetical protein
MSGGFSPGQFALVLHADIFTEQDSDILREPLHHEDLEKRHNSRDYHGFRHSNALSALCFALIEYT